MSEEKLALIRQGHEAFNRGDPEPVIARSTPDVEWVTTGTFPGIRGVYRGPDAIRSWTETLRKEWSEFEVSIEEVLHDEEDMLVLAELLRGCGRESGAIVEMRIYSVYRFEDGKVRRREAFTEREAALEAARRQVSESQRASADRR
jgi:ketosteroid isomerase-like protein